MLLVSDIGQGDDFSDILVFGAGAWFNSGYTLVRQFTGFPRFLVSIEARLAARRHRANVHVA